MLPRHQDVIYSRDFTAQELERREKSLAEDLRDVEAALFALETKYIQQTADLRCGDLINGFSEENVFRTTYPYMPSRLLKHTLREGDRIFSNSSITSGAAVAAAALEAQLKTRRKPESADAGGEFQPSSSPGGSNAASESDDSD